MEMEGTIEQAGTQYWWWAGPANDGAHEEYCVHCRGEDYGVTLYLSDKPSETQARSTAESLISRIEQIQ